MAHKEPTTIQEALRKYGFMRQDVKRVKGDLDMLQCELNTVVGCIARQLIEAAYGAATFEDLAEHVDGESQRVQSRSRIIDRLWWLLEVVYYG